MLSVPKGCFVAAHEAGAIFPVSAGEERSRLWYPTLGQPVPLSAEVIIGHEPSAKFKAECFASRLRGIGYANIVIEEEIERRDLAERVA